MKNMQQTLKIRNAMKSNLVERGTFLKIDGLEIASFEEATFSLYNLFCSLSFEEIRLTFVSVFSSKSSIDFQSFCCLSTKTKEKSTIVPNTKSREDSMKYPKQRYDETKK